MKEVRLERYHVIHLVKQKGKTIGVDILDKESNRQITIYKNNFKVLKDKMDNAIITSDNIIRGKNKNGKLEIRHIENTDTIKLSSTKKIVRVFTIMHEDTKVLTIDRESDILKVYNKDKMTYSLRKNSLSVSDVTDTQYRESL